MQLRGGILMIAFVFVSIPQIARTVSYASIQDLTPRSRISGYRSSPGSEDLGPGRCSIDQINDLRVLLRGISEWCQWAIDVVPERDRQASRVLSTERLLFERVFVAYNRWNRIGVRRRFRALQIEVDHSPGGRLRWPIGTAKTKINCAPRMQSVCRDVGQWSHREPFLERSGIITLVSTCSLRCSVTIVTYLPRAEYES